MGILGKDNNRIELNFQIKTLYLLVSAIEYKLINDNSLITKNKNKLIHLKKKFEDEIVKVD